MADDLPIHLFTDRALQPETRERRLRNFVAMLARGEKIHGP